MGRSRRRKHRPRVDTLVTEQEPSCSAGERRFGWATALFVSAFSSASARATTTKKATTTTKTKPARTASSFSFASVAGSSSPPTPRAEDDDNDADNCLFWRLWSGRRKFGGRPRSQSSPEPLTSQSANSPTKTAEDISPNVVQQSTINQIQGSSNKSDGQRVMRRTQSCSSVPALANLAVAGSSNSTTSETTSIPEPERPRRGPLASLLWTLIPFLPSPLLSPSAPTSPLSLYSDEAQQGSSSQSRSDSANQEKQIRPEGIAQATGAIPIPIPLSTTLSSLVTSDNEEWNRKSSIATAAEEGLDQDHLEVGSLGTGFSTSLSFVPSNARMTSEQTPPNTPPTYTTHHDDGDVPDDDDTISSRPAATATAAAAAIAAQLFPTPPASIPSTPPRSISVGASTTSPFLSVPRVPPTSLANTPDTTPQGTPLSLSLSSNAYHFSATSSPQITASASSPLASALFQRLSNLASTDEEPVDDHHPCAEKETVEESVSTATQVAIAEVLLLRGENDGLDEERAVFILKQVLNLEIDDKTIGETDALADPLAEECSCTHTACGEEKNQKLNQNMGGSPSSVISDDDMHLLLHAHLTAPTPTQELSNAEAYTQAQALLAFAYEFGLGGLSEEYAVCEDLYAQAAVAGNTLAMCRIAFLRRYGRPGVKINRTEADSWAKRISAIGPSAVQWLIEAADRHNHACANYCLGVCYHDGVGLERDPTRAVHYYQKAAAQGHARGKGILGYCYGEGFGVAKDPSTAFSLYLSAAELGESVSMYNVAHSYEDGVGVEQDLNEAIVWYTRSAMRGNCYAQNSLGCMYEEGHGLPRNWQKALHWYHRAAKQGYAWAQCNLGRCLVNGDETGVEEEENEDDDGTGRLNQIVEEGANGPESLVDGTGVSPLPPSLQRAPSRRRHHTPESRGVCYLYAAARQGHTRAQYFLARCLLTGVGSHPANPSRALKWLRRAAAAGHDLAQNFLGRIYEEGLEGLLAVNVLEAAKWYVASVREGNIMAVTNLASLYLEYDHIVPVSSASLFRSSSPLPALSSQSQDSEELVDTPTPPHTRRHEAFRLIRYAATQGQPRAQTLLAHLFLAGDVATGISPDPSEALLWYELAAGNGWVPAMTHLAWCLESGTGCDGHAQDQRLAIEWYAKAAALGDEWARQRLVVVLLGGGVEGVRPPSPPAAPSVSSTSSPPSPTHPSPSSSSSSTLSSRRPSLIIPSSSSSNDPSPLWSPPPRERSNSCDIPVLPHSSTTATTTNEADPDMLALQHSLSPAVRLAAQRLGIEALWGVGGYGVVAPAA